MHNTALRPPTAADLPLLALLHEQTPPAQREESGTTGLPAFGYLEDGVLLAVCRGSHRVHRTCQQPGSRTSGT